MYRPPTCRRPSWRPELETVAAWAAILGALLTLAIIGE